MSPKKGGSRGSGGSNKAARPTPKPVAAKPAPVARASGPDEAVAAPPALDDVAGRAPVDIRRWLPVLGLIIGVWAMLPKFSGPNLNTEDAVEFADHVVPGIVILATSLACLYLRSRGAGMIPLVAGMTVLLAGFWMVATHASLVAQAFRDEAPWPGTIYHTSSAVAVFGLGLLWVATHWSDLDTGSDSAKADPKSA